MHIFISLISLITVYGSCHKQYTYHTTTRHYCISADHINWNYAPMSFNSTMDLTGMYEDEAEAILTASDKNIGKVFKKAVYRQYQYNKKKNRCEWSIPLTHSSVNGVTGPTIRAVVGDTVKVHFYNNCSSQYYNIRPHGLFYTQSFDDKIGYGEETTYTWLALSDSGPDGQSFSSRVWMYHSDSSLGRDSHTGLLGSIVVVRANAITSNSQRSAARPCDVDHEHVLMLSEFDESQSWLWIESLKALEGDDDNLYQDEDLISNSYRKTINGYMFGNLGPSMGLTFPAQSRVRWHILSASDDSYVQTERVEWTNNPVTDSTGHYSDYVAFSSPGYATVDMIPESIGIWPLVSGHQSHRMAGMSALFEVSEPEDGANYSDNGEEGALGSGTVYAVFLSIIVISVVAVLVMVLFAFKTTKPNMVSDRDPILPDSSHHVAPPRSDVQQKSSTSKTVEV
mmetsp:Transcript_2577/g.3912  ORF Transcript_2577/g.3912 Transcript_2577/m.3912 type:complete len:453 (+) Transcript_2577:72-1430(+)